MWSHTVAAALASPGKSYTHIRSFIVASYYSFEQFYPFGNNKKAGVWQKYRSIGSSIVFVQHPCLYVCMYVCVYVGIYCQGGGGYDCMMAFIFSVGDRYCMMILVCHLLFFPSTPCRGRWWCLERVASPCYCSAHHLCSKAPLHFTPLGRYLPTYLPTHLPTYLVVASSLV